MPKYRVLDPETGYKYVFEGDTEPTESEIDEYLGKSKKVQGVAEYIAKPVESDKVPDWMMDNPTLAGVYGGAKAIAKPLLEAGGLIGGGLLGAAGGPAGSIAGAGLGYGAGREIVKGIETLAGERSPQDVTEGVTDAAKNVGEGAMMEASGRALGLAAPAVAKGVGKLYRGLAGKVSNVGSEALQQAYKATPEFRQAQKGISPTESIDDLRTGIAKVKEVRDTAWKTTEADILKKYPNKIDTKPLEKEVQSSYNEFFTVGKNPKPRAPIEDINNMKDMIRLYNEYSLEPTAENLHAFKSIIGQKYGASPTATGKFSKRFSDAITETFKKDVPEYATLDKSYSEASKKIGKFNKELSTGKDSTVFNRLKRFVRNDDPIGNELLDELEKASGVNIKAKVAGELTKEWLPRGITPYVASSSIGAGALASGNPGLLALLAGTSPRLQGNLMYGLGKTSQALKGAASKTGADKIPLSLLLYMLGKQGR